VASALTTTFIVRANVDVYVTRLANDISAGTASKMFLGEKRCLIVKKVRLMALELSLGQNSNKAKSSYK